MPAKPHPIKVAIADDHSIFRNGVIASLRPFSNIKIVCEAISGSNLLEQLPKTLPDIILLDMKMSDMDGVEICKNIKRLFPRIKVIGLSVYDHYNYISSLFEAGGSGYLLKDVDITEIVKAIQTVYTDGSYMMDKASIPLIKKLMDIQHPSVYYHIQHVTPFKDYELEILKLIAKEHTTQEIAENMKLSPKTIENYRGIMLTKIGAKNTAGLITYAIKKGLIEL
ncbi:MAG: response regulator transcription factor [Bacteroidota bacterium]